MEKFINQAEIDKVQEAINEVWPGLKLSTFGMVPENLRLAVNVGMWVPEKGNKKKIEALKALGFRKVWRELKGPRPDLYTNDPRAFYILLKKEL